MDKNDIVLEICKFLSIPDIISVLSTCSYIRSVCTPEGHYYSYIRNLTRRCTNYYLNSDQPVYYPGTDDPFFNCDIHNEEPEIVDAVLEILKIYFPDAKRGDIVWRTIAPEAIYNGDKFELFTYNEHYQICFPPSYITPNEFPITYWSEIPVVPFDPLLYLNELIDNFHYTDDNEYASTYFICNYIRYNVSLPFDLLDMDLPLLFANSRYLRHNRYPMVAGVRDIDLLTELVLKPNFD